MKNIQSNFTKKSPISKALIVILVAVLGLACYTVETEINRARAEATTTPAWILCRDYLIIRMAPSRKAPEVGQLDPCDEVEIDGRTKDGFAHIVAPVDGWVWAGNIVFSQPVEVNEKYTVVARTRVACRRWCDGPQVAERPWLISGSEVRVYYMSDEWAVTARGYVRTEWLEL